MCQALSQASPREGCWNPLSSLSDPHVAWFRASFLTLKDHNLRRHRSRLCHRSPETPGRSGAKPCMAVSCGRLPTRGHRRLRTNPTRKASLPAPGTAPRHYVPCLTPCCSQSPSINSLGGSVSMKWPLLTSSAAARETLSSSLAPCSSSYHMETGRTKLLKETTF